MLVSLARTMVIGCRGKKGCRSKRLMAFLRILRYLPSLLRRLRVVEPRVHHLRLSPVDDELIYLLPKRGEFGSLSVSEVQEDDGPEE
jgi:hypothetical protein